MTTNKRDNILPIFLCLLMAIVVSVGIYSIIKEKQVRQNLAEEYAIQSTTIDDIYTIHSIKCTEYGCELYYKNEIKSGIQKYSNPQANYILNYLRAGDTIIMYRAGNLERFKAVE